MNLDPAVWGSVFPELAEPAQGLRPILGFRLNRVQLSGWTGRRLTLTSLGAGQYAWLPGRNTAACIRGVASRHASSVGIRPHVAPASGCACGFYACHDLDGLGLVLGGTVPDGTILVGVAGSGVVRVHERGWRAQHARIIVFVEELPWNALGGLRLNSLDGLRLASYFKPSQRIKAATARALEDRYRVPVVPLSKVREVMLESGDFMEETS